MKISKHLFATVFVLSAFATTAEAATFDWSYEFNNGTTLSGAFDGVLGGDLDTITVSSVSNVLLNGGVVGLPLIVSSLTYFFGGGPSAAVVSISGLLMDICVDTSGGCFGDGFFFDTLFGNGAVTNLPTAAEDYPFDAGDWSITERVSAVPVPAALPLLATGIGALGVAGWRRRRQETAKAA